MRTKLAIVLLASLLLAASAPRVAAQEALDPKQTLYYNKPALKLPFSVKNDSRGRVVEVRLFAAYGNGDWTLVGRASPNQKQFEFRDNRDGLFLFCIQVVRENGEQEPPTDHLVVNGRVVIDTQPPRARLQAFTEKGDAGVEWEVTDDNLDPKSIRLEYRWPDQASWMPLDRDVPFQPRDRRSWQLKPDQKLEIRLRAQDLAKNEVVTPGVWTPPDPAQNANRFVDQARDDPGPATPARPTLFYVNNRRVRLEYDVKVGPSGFDRAELWYTIDGRDWQQDQKASEKSGEAPAEPEERAGKRALVFEAPRDGPFGFIIIARNKAGIGPDPPKKGDAARVQVVVDTQKPQVRLLKAEPRPSGDRGGAILEITWEARDANMAPQPITLEYAAEENGPWKPIADRLDNTGRFTWTVGPNEPYQFFVRVRCTDRANNVGEDRTAKPVIVDLTVPSVDIKDVGPGGR